MTEMMPLLKTKVNTPRLHPSTIQRKRVQEKLSILFQKRWMLVSAPSGYGKSTAVAEWLKTLDMPYSFLSLDEKDNDFMRFSGYLIEAIRTISPSFGSHYSKNGYSSAELAVRKFANDCEKLPYDFVLVIDDYHVITNEMIHQTMNYLIKYAPNNMHVIFISRTVPPLLIGGDTAFITIQDLQFTVEEIKSFVSMNGLKLTDKQIKQLAFETEGWIGGLQIVMMSGHLEGASLPSLKKDFHLFAYLTEEMFKTQSDDVQQFLLYTSILERMNGSLCEALTGMPNSEELLHTLEYSNVLVVSLDEERYWYRYHHLFSDFLQQKLLEHASEKRLDLYEKAAQWFKQHEYPQEAIDYYLTAKKYESALHLLSSEASVMIQRGRAETLFLWLRTIPPDILLEHLDISVYYVWALLLTNEMSQAKHWVARIENRMETIQSGNHPNDCYKEVERNLVVLRAILGFFLDDFQTFQQHLPSLIPIVECHDLACLKGINLNISSGALLDTYLGNRGRLRFPLKLASFTVTHWKAKPNECYGFSLALLGECLYEQNERDQAIKYTDQAIKIGCELERSGIVIPAFLMRAKYEYEIMHDRQKTMEWLNLAKEWTKRYRVEQYDSYILAFEARLAIKNNDKEKVKRWLSECHLQLDGILCHKRLFEHLTFVRVLMDLENYDAAIYYLERLSLFCERHQHIKEMIELKWLQAKFKFLQQDTKSAAELLGSSLSLAYEENYRRLFLDEGAKLREVLSLYLQKQKQEKRNDSQVICYAREIFHQLNNETKEGFQSLTKKEFEILLLMVKGLTNKEIAEQLTISYETVKQHVKNIFRKLMVKNRVQAIAKYYE